MKMNKEKRGKKENIKDNIIRKKTEMGKMITVRLRCRSRGIDNNDRPDGTQECGKNDGAAKETK